MIALIFGLIVGVLIGWYTTKPEAVETLVNKVVGLVKK